MFLKFFFEKVNFEKKSADDNRNHEKIPSEQNFFSGDCTTFCLRVATKARTYSLGALHPSFKVSKILRDALREVLPENAHEICSGKLFISMTRVSDRQSVIISEYDSKEEVIQVRKLKIQVQ